MPSPKTAVAPLPPSSPQAKKSPNKKTDSSKNGALAKTGSSGGSGGAGGGGGMPSKVGSGKGEGGEKTRRERREERAIREDEDTGPKKILKAEVAKPVVEKRQAPVEKAPEPEQAPPEEKKRRTGRTRPYHGNMNLVVRANKGAARAAMRGQKSQKKGAGSSSAVVKKKLVRKPQGAWALFTRKLFGTWTQEAVTLRDEKTKAAITALSLTEKDIKRLKMSFDDIDIDGSGSIDVEEFFKFLDEKRSGFTDALFALIDLDHSGTIEFEEYVRVLASYCMYTEEDILRFCFDGFDKDGSGTIDEEEFIKLLQTVNGATPLFSGNFQKALEDFDIDDDGLVDFPEFCALYKKYPMILFPAFRLQDAMHRLTLGHDKWAHLLRRIEQQRALLDYRASHYGMDPPLPFSQRMARRVLPCLYPPLKIHPALLEEYGLDPSGIPPPSARGKKGGGGAAAAIAAGGSGGEIGGGGGGKGGKVAAVPAPPPTSSGRWIPNGQRRSSRSS